MRINVFDMTTREKLLFLFKECHHLQKSVAGNNTNDRLEYAIAVFTSQILKAYTIWSICNPLPREEILENNGIVHDFQSGYVLLRSMYETNLVSSFVLLDSEFHTSRKVVVKVAKLHGLREQNWLLTKMKSMKPEFKEIKTQLTELRTQILDHHEFSNLPEYARSYVNKEDIPNTRWFPREFIIVTDDSTTQRVNALEQLALRAGFHESQHFQYNKYYSNHTHSDPFAVMQVGAVRSFEESAVMTESLLNQCENFLAIALRIHHCVCVSEKFRLGISGPALVIIDIWEHINGSDWTKESDKI